MIDYNTQNCPICGDYCELKIDGDNSNYRIVNCDKIDTKFYLNMSVYDDDEKEFRKRCNMICAYLLEKPYKKIDGRDYYKFYYDGQEIDDPAYVNVFELMKDYPKNTNDKLDRIILNISRKFSNIGAIFTLDDLHKSLMFAESLDKDALGERQTLKNYLKERNFLSHNGKEDRGSYKLTAKAWELVAEQTKKQKEINNQQSQDIKENETHLKTKIFISHSSKDEKYCTELKNYLIKIGVSDELIYYTSIQAFGVLENIKEVRKNLINARLVIFIVSENFYNSPYCLNEMGAVWYDGKKNIFIIGLDDIKDENDFEGFLDKNNKLHRFEDASIDILYDIIDKNIIPLKKDVKYANQHKKELLAAIKQKIDNEVLCKKNNENVSSIDKNAKNETITEDNQMLDEYSFLETREEKEILDMTYSEIFVLYYLIDQNARDIFSPCEAEEDRIDKWKKINKKVKCDLKKCYDDGVESLEIREAISIDEWPRLIHLTSAYKNFSEEILEFLLKIINKEIEWQ
ncbi:MAG: toll/interleukin-1 receptor domain-containing protein [Fibromonadales bacterium]|nr:toll/interleukin-1 receptor domain-containing protein [Fibromonadales bacterium]